MAALLIQPNCRLSTDDIKSLLLISGVAGDGAGASSSRGSKPRLVLGDYKPIPYWGAHFNEEDEEDEEEKPKGRPKVKRDKIRVARNALKIMRDKFTITER